RSQVVTDLDVDRMVTLKQGDARHGRREAGAGRCDTCNNASRIFEPLDRALKYRHQTGAFVDYEVQPLLPYEPSRHGPPIAVADVNGDRLDDVFIGGAGGVPARLFLHGGAGGCIGSRVGAPVAAARGYE